MNKYESKEQVKALIIMRAKYAVNLINEGHDPEEVIRWACRKTFNAGWARGQNYGVWKLQNKLNRCFTWIPCPQAEQVSGDLEIDERDEGDGDEQ